MRTQKESDPSKARCGCSCNVAGDPVHTPPCSKALPHDDDEDFSKTWFAKQALKAEIDKNEARQTLSHLPIRCGYVDPAAYGSGWCDKRAVANVRHTASDETDEDSWVLRCKKHILNVDIIVGSGEGSFDLVVRPLWRDE